ncbi:putative alkaline shock family protein YloU [Saccharomonospora amisosensis]|uniref:Putative alkaline shock family protein YloU n=1 Tax=Saccharomonospora amisosensis TaxID=1128677 RepID=A0A7X5UMB6_9PSEU|nr:Asp23/Gls24 family envelope stress response protein [Saccharomonospora amisosensis]NIJ10654.1 putative alkaline shock family protein YloU [Saccharomonospora amisosensis]
MSTPTSQKNTDRTAGDGADAQRRGNELSTSRGTTTIADAVVQKIAGLAAREVSGVYSLGGGAARAMGALRERIPGASASAGQGVAVEVGEKQAAVDLELLVEYGVSIVDLAQAVRRNVISSIERMTGLEVVEVNLSVNDIHLPGDDNEEESSESSGRVQ